MQITQCEKELAKRLDFFLQRDWEPLSVSYGNSSLYVLMRKRKRRFW